MVLQVLAALLYGASGVMKVFMFDKVSEGVPSFGALPRMPGRPSASSNSSHGRADRSRRLPLAAGATVVAATILTIESLVFVWVHVKYREITSIILSGVLGLLMAFIVYGRMVLKPIF